MYVYDSLNRVINNIQYVFYHYIIHHYIIRISHKDTSTLNWKVRKRARI